jgi:hypothetical protein
MPVAACQNPHQCLSRRDEIFRKDAIWTRDHECTSCRIGTARRMMAFVPEKDIDSSDMRHAPINPKDFDDVQPVKHMEKRGPKPKTHCSKGHPYSEYGAKWGDKRNRCRLCNTANKKAWYQRKKEAMC